MPSPADQPRLNDVHHCCCLSGSTPFTISNSHEETRTLLGAATSLSDHNLHEKIRLAPALEALIKAILKRTTINKTSSKRWAKQHLNVFNNGCVHLLDTHRTPQVRMDTRPTYTNLRLCNGASLKNSQFPLMIPLREDVFYCFLLEQLSPSCYRTDRLLPALGGIASL